MNLMMVGGMFVWRILLFNLGILTVSKALLMSRVTRTVRDGGCFWLKPSLMVLMMLCSAVLVECLGLKPCWCGFGGMLSVMWWRMVFSRTLAIGVRSEIGLKDGPSLWFFPGFGMGMILPSFQICGMVFCWRARL